MRENRLYSVKQFRYQYVDVLFEKKKHKHKLFSSQSLPIARPLYCRYHRLGIRKLIRGCPLFYAKPRNLHTAQTLSLFCTRWDSPSWLFVPPVRESWTHTTNIRRCCNADVSHASKRFCFEAKTNELRQNWEGVGEVIDYAISLKCSAFVQHVDAACEVKHEHRFIRREHLRKKFNSTLEIHPSPPTTLVAGETQLCTPLRHGELNGIFR